MMKLDNKNVAITGTLRLMIREKAYQLIRNENGTPKDNMNNTIDILVVTDEMVGKETTKIRKAKDNKHIRIISETHFYYLVGIVNSI